MRAKLMLENGEAEPSVYELGPRRVVKLGRDRQNAIVLRDRLASRWHAEIRREEGQWFLHDCKSLNGTQLNGLDVHQVTRLEDGYEIRIGEIRLRFCVEPSEEGEEPDECPEPSPVRDSRQTDLQPDELTALFAFMDASLRETSPQALVRLALGTVREQTGAVLAGFLSLDEEDPLPRMVVPEDLPFDAHLSRQLTLRVQKEAQTVWLSGSERSPGQGDSLVAYRDALCVPLREGEAPLGALHVYHTGRGFTRREVRFCEALAVYLAKSLHVLRARLALEADNSRLRVHAADGYGLVGDSPAMKELRRQIERLRERPNVVLITGESGVGKELVALALHRASSRRDGPLVTVNCAAIAPGLQESELFGHCKHAFTDAREDRPGFFQQADMGTIFLDEIGELHEGCQAKLLRVTENRTFRPVGATAEMKADVRILAATNRDLERESQEGRFRKDLFFRLVGKIHVPALRERREDVPALARHFLEIFALEYRRRLRLTGAAERKLQDYHWPGNVRQLRSFLENLVAMSEAAEIDARDLRLPTDPPPDEDGPCLNLKKLEAWAIRQALGRERGVVVRTAQVLGIHRDTLAMKMKEYGIERP